MLSTYIYCSTVALTYFIFLPSQENHAVPQLDSGLQLAMALSLSLQDQKQAVENAKKGDTAKEVSLDHFGFIGKPVLDGIQPRPLTSASRGEKNIS